MAEESADEIKVKYSRKMERAFLQDEINFRRDELERLSREHRLCWKVVMETLNRFDALRLSVFISKSENKELTSARERHLSFIEHLKRERFGNASGQHSGIFNLSDLELSIMDKEVLARGLKFGIPRKVSREEVLAEFELFHQQLRRQEPRSREAEEVCRSKLAGIAESFHSARGSREGFLLEKEHIKTIKALRENDEIIISRPDKGQGVVLMNKADYVRKMNDILEDTNKFKMVGDVASHDHTLRNERSLQQLLRRLKDDCEISHDVYDRIRPTGSTRPRMYGLPKVHKQNVPLRPILAMVGSAQHATAQWLAELLQPALERYSKFVVKDSFTFSNKMREFSPSTSGHMCSYEIVSLFTNVSLSETIDICADVLYRSDDLPPPALTEPSFRMLLSKVTTGVEFSFNGVMYQQIEGVAMGSPLGPVLANIFVGYHEQRLQIEEDEHLLLYDRYVDDTFAFHTTKEHSVEFLEKLNSLHPSLRFTCEHEDDNKLPFLDVLMVRHGSTESISFSTAVYRKPTFTGLYTRWDSFSCRRYKINLIRSLVSRAVKICSEDTLENEIEQLRQILANNGYPSNVVERVIRSALTPRQPAIGPKQFPVYLRLPWIGTRASEGFETRIDQAVKRGYGTCSVKVIFTSRPMFCSSVKDRLPTQQLSNVIYLFQCRCDCRYVGKTTQHLETRIKQHVPCSARLAIQAGKKPVTSSAICEHLTANPECAKEFSSAKFSVLHKARNRAMLDMLEAVCITTREPELCKQMQFVKKLHLLRGSERNER